MVWNIENGHMKGMFCPVDSSEEFIAVFSVEMSQIDTEKDKIHKTFQFPKILCILFSIFDKFFGLER